MKIHPFIYVCVILITLSIADRAYAHTPPTHTNPEFQNDQKLDPSDVGFDVSTDFESLVASKKETLTIRSEPSGATFTVEGFVGVFTTPQTFTDVRAQTYSIFMNLNDYENKQVFVQVLPNQETDREVILVPRFGFLKVITPDVTLFVAKDNSSESELTHQTGEEIRLSAGTYTYTARGSNQQEVTGYFTINPGDVTTLDTNINKTYGSLTVQNRDAALFLRPISETKERRFVYQRGRPLQLESGTYVYRLERTFYETVTETITIAANQNTTLNATFKPEYATLRVRANTGDFTLKSDLNVAPYATRTDEINLELGERTIVVSAVGYSDVAIQVNAQAGERINRTVFLEPLEVTRDREMREQMPPGLLNVTADVPDAEIFVNGESRGVGEVNLYLIPDTYDVQVHHPRFGVNRKRVNVRSEALSEELFELRPSKQNAFMRSLILPGSGLLYTKQKRGYFYMAGAALAAGFAIRAMHHYSEAGNKYDIAFENYQKAQTINDAAFHRAETLKYYNNQNQALDNIILGLTVFGGIYIIQLLDIHFITPQYGYRGTKVIAGISHQGINLKVGF